MIITRLELVELLNLLSDEINLKILSYIKIYEELCVCQFEDILEIPQPTISRHLKALYTARIISVRKEGRWHYYRLKKLPDFVHEVLNLAMERYNITREKLLKRCNTSKQLKNNFPRN
ncbi:MAG: metalloregulator ArsR/SmtB family transcription factor [Kosmotogaceae bacterium]